MKWMRSWNSKLLEILTTNLLIIQREEIFYHLFDIENLNKIINFKFLTRSASTWVLMSPVRASNQWEMSCRGSKLVSFRDRPGQVIFKSSFSNQLKDFDPGDLILGRNPEVQKLKPGTQPGTPVSGPGKKKRFFVDKKIQYFFLLFF